MQNPNPMSPPPSEPKTERTHADTSVGRSSGTPGTVRSFEFFIEHDGGGDSAGLWRRGAERVFAENQVEASNESQTDGTHGAASFGRVARCSRGDIDDLTVARIEAARAHLDVHDTPLEHHEVERYPLTVHELRQGERVLWRMEVLPGEHECRVREIYF